MYNRYSGIYKFGNETQVENSSHFSIKKCALWTGKYIQYLKLLDAHSYKGSCSLAARFSF
jgi:phage antirepressor YoqD-like protein